MDFHDEQEPLLDKNNYALNIDEVFEKKIL